MTDPGAGMADVLLGLGLPGVALLALGWAVTALYKRSQEDAAYHRQRADRLEEALRALNATVHSEYVTTIGKANEAIADSLKALGTFGKG